MAQDWCSTCFLKNIFFTHPHSAARLFWRAAAAGRLHLLPFLRLLRRDAKNAVNPSRRAEKCVIHLTSVLDILPIARLNQADGFADLRPAAGPHSTIPSDRRHHPPHSTPKSRLDPSIGQSQSPHPIPHKTVATTLTESLHKTVTAAHPHTNPHGPLPTPLPL